MYIQWLGQTSFKIQAKVQTEEVVIVTDPISTTSDFKTSRLHADIATISDYENPLIATDSVNGTTKSPEPFLIFGPGEYETKGAFVTGIDARVDNDGVKEGSNVIYRFDVEGMRVVHLGLLNLKKLTDQQIETLGMIDILFIPVGGGSALTAKDAAQITNILEPRIIIPMNFKVKGVDTKLDSVDVFTKELGAGSIVPESKFRIVKKDLPQSDTEIKVLSLG